MAADNANISDRLGSTIGRLFLWLSMVSYIPIAGSHDARNATGATSFPSQVCVHEKIDGAHLPEHATSSFCGCSPRRSENQAARAPDITRMYVRVRPRARAHLVMSSWVFAQIPSEHPCANTSTHNSAPSRKQWRNIVAQVKQMADAPETARPMT